MSKIRLECNLLQYADDTVLFVEGLTVDEIRGKIQHDMDILVNYCDKNQLTINPTKTKTMLYTYRVGLTLNGVMVKGQELDDVDNYKYLGILMDNDLLKKSSIKL